MPAASISAGISGAAWPGGSSPRRNVCRSGQRHREALRRLVEGLPQAATMRSRICFVTCSMDMEISCQRKSPGPLPKGGKRNLLEKRVMVYCAILTPPSTKGVGGFRNRFYLKQDKHLSHPIWQKYRAISTSNWVPGRQFFGGMKAKRKKYTIASADGIFLHEPLGFQQRIGVHQGVSASSF